MDIITNPELCKLGNRLHLEILAFGYAKVDPAWSGDVSSPLYSRLYYITEGEFSIQPANAERITLNKGKWYLIPAGRSFQYDCSCAMEHFYFHIKLCDFDRTDLLRNCPEPLCLDCGTDTNYDLLLKCLESKNLTDGLYLRQMVFDLIIALIEKHKIHIKAEDYSQCIYKALRYIKQNLSMQLTIQDIATNTYVSKSTLTKCFRKELHMSVNEYINATIMAEAEQLLMTNNISIHDLSQKFGYTDQLYFSRRFREKFNKSPRAYRKERII